MKRSEKGFSLRILSRGLALGLSRAECMTETPGRIIQMWIHRRT